MKSDGPIVAEVRRARAKVFARFDYDLHKYCAHLMARQEEEAKNQASEVRKGRRRKVDNGPVGKLVTSPPAFKASVRKARKNRAEGKGIPLAEARRRLGV